MINILSKIFCNTGFKIDKDQCYACNNGKNTYYVYANYNCIDDFKNNIYDEQNKLYDYITSLENSNELKKNTTFIIAVKLNDISEKKNIQELILDLEEDKYFFKKYVITYFQNEVTEFNNELSSYEDIKSFMKDNINNPDKFDEYKLNNTMSYYSLILKLYMKIPHLSCGEIFKKDNIINLKEDILNNIESKELLPYYNKIKILEESNLDEYIDGLLIIEGENK